MLANGVLVLVVSAVFLSGILIIVELANRKHGGE